MVLAAGVRLGRYEVLGFIGAGGMGEVYEGRDTRLGRTVALKILPPHFASDPARRHRFEREARAVSALEHPNICVLHDVGSEADIDFLVLERLHGETLAERLNRAPLVREEAIAIAIQIAGALDAAHQKGVVHRDVKPGNVMLTSSGVKLLDFGLARLRGEGGGDEVSTAFGSGEPQKAAGTRPYMSPEQATGGVSDARTDVWALGVVLYEMLTGRCPFTGDSPESLTLAIREREPPPLSSTDPPTSPALEHVVRRCLAKDAADRWQSASDVATELQWIAAGRAATGRASPLRRRARTTAAAALVIVIAGLGVWGWRSRAAKPPLDPRRVVVAVFENRTGDASLDMLGRLAADHIGEGLARLPSVQVVPDSTARNTGAGLLVAGAYYLSGGDIRIQARLTDAITGRSTAFDPALGPRTTPMAAVESVRQRIMGAVALRADATWLPGHDERPPTYEAYQEYLVGMERAGDDDAAAIAHFERAAELDPGFISPRLSAVGFSVNSGDLAGATRHLSLLEEQMARLTPYQRLKVAAHRAQLAGRNEEAYVAEREARRLVPGDAREAFFFAYLAGLANHHREAVEAATAPLDWKPLHEQRGVHAGFYFWNLAESLHLLGEHERELTEVRRGQALHPEVPYLRLWEASALVALGRLEEAQQVVTQAMTLARVGYLDSGDLLIGTALELRVHGHREASVAMAERAIEWLRGGPPAQTNRKQARRQLARSLLIAGHWREAAPICRALARESPDDIEDAGTLGILAARRGARAEALRISEQLRHLDRPNLLGRRTLMRARIAAWLGEQDEAVDLLREAFAQGVPHDIRPHRDIDLEPLRGYAPFEALIKAE
jgi:tetratricopeptide (TPR) repeat protein